MKYVIGIRQIGMKKKSIQPLGETGYEKQQCNNYFKNIGDEV